MQPSSELLESLRVLYSLFEQKAVPVYLCIVFSLQIVNAVHLTDLNALAVPSTILAFPYYDETLGVKHTIASMGEVLAHEISHGLDPNIPFSHEGQYEDIWSNVSRVEFEVGFTQATPGRNFWANYVVICRNGQVL